jgi:hypothetical protein
MPTDIDNFLLSLAAAIAAATSLQLASTPRSIWAHDAVEADSTPVYTVLRVYGGAEPGNFAGARVPSASIQADTRGFDAPLVLSQAWKVHESFLNADGSPWMEKSIAAKKFDVDGVTIVADASVNYWIVSLTNFGGAPGIVGRDDSDRRVATSNYEMEFQPIASFTA